MKSVKLKVDRPAEKSLSEIYQQKDIRFSFANDLGKDHLRQIHVYAKCRDFLGDVLFAEETDTKVSIYSFDYDPKKNKIDRDKTRFLLKLPNAGDAEHMKENLVLLHEIEHANGFQLTELIQNSETKNEIYVEGDPTWQEAIFMVSLYTFLLKCIAYPIKDRAHWVEYMCDQATNEGQYILKAKGYLVKKIHDLKSILKKGLTVSGWDKSEKNISIIHNCSGFVSIFAEEYCKLVKDNKYHVLATS